MMRIGPRKHVTGKMLAALALACSARSGLSADHCKDALARAAVCQSANSFAIDQMRARHLAAISVVQNVATGALVAFAASRPKTLDVSSEVPPLSLSKLFLAASWWDNKPRDFAAENVHEMLVSGSDAAGRELALALREGVGRKIVASDLQRYGFNRGAEPFWAEIDPQWSKRLTPQPAYAAIDALSDQDWSSVLSIGETHMVTTALHVSRFLQAVGNGGLLCPPVARRMTKKAEQSEGLCGSPIRMLSERSARELAAAMLDVVKRGTATRIKDALIGTGWTIGGKTGTGGIPGAPMNKQNGWFAGLILDRRREARFTVATFVTEGGPGGGNAAEISAGLARFLTGEDFRN